MEESRKPPRKPRAPAAPKAPARHAQKAVKAAAPAKPVARKTAARTVPTQAERNEMVRTAAYFRAQQRGFAPGWEWEDWLVAEAEIRALLEPAPTARATRAPAKKSVRA